MTPLYTVRTWDSDLEDFTPHDAQSQNITLWQVRSVLRDLRRLGYSCHRVRMPHGGYDSDPSVLVERVDE